MSTAAQVMAAMNSYMLPHGTRCSASPLVGTEVICRASPAHVSRNAARTHGPDGQSDWLGTASAGSGRRRPPDPVGSSPRAATPSAAPPAAPVLLAPAPPRATRAPA